MNINKCVPSLKYFNDGIKELENNIVLFTGEVSCINSFQNLSSVIHNVYKSVKTYEEMASAILTSKCEFTKKAFHGMESNFVTLQDTIAKWVLNMAGTKISNKEELSEVEFFWIAACAFYKQNQSLTALQSCFGHDAKNRYEKVAFIISIFVSDNILTASILNKFEKIEGFIQDAATLILELQNKISDSDSVDLLTHSLKIIERYVQLQYKVFNAEWFEKKNSIRPSRFEVLKIAQFIEEILPFEFDGENEKIFKMRDSGLVRALQIQRTDQKTYVVILAKSNCSTMQMDGTVKKITSAALVELEDSKITPLHVVRGCNTLEVNKDQLEGFRKELPINKKLAECSSYFVKLITWCEYSVQKRIQSKGTLDQTQLNPQKQGMMKYTRISAIYEACQGDLFDLSLEDRKKITNKDRMLLARDILEGLSIMHNNGYIHFDLKLENILHASCSSGVRRAKICDFGFTLPLTSLSDLFKPICYGTLQFTPPELFLNKKFYQEQEAMGQKDLKESYIKLDLFACGRSLQELISTWPPSVDKALNDGFTISKNSPQNKNPESADQQNYSQQVLVARGNYFTELNKFCDELKLQGPIGQLVSGLLCLDPSQRTTIIEAKEQLDSIIAKM